jgi:hypothetical protein
MPLPQIESHGKTFIIYPDHWNTPQKVTDGTMPITSQMPARSCSATP